VLQNSRCVDVEIVATICGRRSACTLILHGDDDQIVPIGASAMLSCKIVKNATLKVYKGAPHGQVHDAQKSGQCEPARLH
jgi:pimeloyl-ACP methyl ester carboxylesterase